MRGRRFHYAFGAVLVVGFAVCTWLVTGESSPLRDYFLWHVELPNLYRRLHIGPYIVGTLLSGNAHQPSSVAFLGAAAVQWFAVGFLLSFVFNGFRLGRHDHNT